MKLGRVAYNGKRVLGVSIKVGSELVQSPEAVWHNLVAAVLELRDDLRRVDVSSKLGSRARVCNRAWLSDLLCDTRDDRALLLLLVIAASSNRCIEMDRWRDDVNVLGQVRRDAVLVAGDVRLSSLMLEQVVVGLQKRLGFLHSGIELQPTTAKCMGDPFLGDTRFFEPCLDGVDRLLASVMLATSHCSQN